MKKIVYIDMDNVMVDFPSGIAKLDEKTKQEYEGRYDEVEGIFSLMEPMPMCFLLRLDIIHPLGVIK